jgi:preprotein translocase subunit SecD
MSKGKSITLLTIVSVLLAALLALTFIRFPVGAAKTYTSALGAIQLDYDMEGGVAYTLRLTEDNEEEVEDISQVINTIEYRMNALGYSTYTVKAVKSTDKDVLDYDVRVEVKATETVDSDIAVAIATGEVAFYGGTSANPTEQILEGKKVVNGATYNGAVSMTNGTAAYQLTISFTNVAYDYLVDAIKSAKDAGNSYYLEIKLGDTVLLGGTSPIDETYFMNGSLPITSSTEASARQMVLQVASGGLKYEYEIVSAEKITSPYGANIATNSAIVIGGLFVILLAMLIVLYKGFGIISALSILAFMLGEVWMLIAVPGVVLSLGGVIGIALALILAVYSIAITASRVKQEYVYSDKTVKAAINKGFKQSLVPVISLNVVVGVVALAFFIFATGALRGFAVTLGIGAVLSAISALVFARMFTALVLPLVKDKEKFLNVKKVEA